MNGEICKKALDEGLIKEYSDFQLLDLGFTKNKFAESTLRFRSDLVAAIE